MIDRAFYVRRDYTEYRVTFSGYTQYIDLESVYKGVSARDKVVLRCNLASEIVRDEYLSSDMIHYADFVCTVLMGLCFSQVEDYNSIAEKLSSYLKMFVSLDTTFCRKLEKIYRFNYMLADPPVSLYNVIATDFKRCVMEAKSRFDRSVKAKTGITTMYFDGPVVYYAINDVIGNYIEHDKRFKQEVLSVAKNWDYTIKCV